MTTPKITFEYVFLAIFGDILTPNVKKNSQKALNFCIVENINKVKKCESLIKFECVVGEIYLRNHER